MTDQEFDEHVAMLRASKAASKGMVSADTMRELSDNAGDTGLISGVLQGIELTPTLLPNQKEAIAEARKAISRIRDRSQNCLQCGFVDVRCYDCGRSYLTFDLDVIIPDDQWKQICPKPYDGAGSGGILCPDCIVKRGSKLQGI